MARQTAITSTVKIAPPPKLMQPMVRSDDIRTSESHPITVSVVMTYSGRLSLCYCPGKNVVRDGVKWQRNLEVI